MKYQGAEYPDIKKVPKWLREILIYCYLKEKKYSLLLSVHDLLQEIYFDGGIHYLSWKQRIKETWFIINMGNAIVFTGDQKECLASDKKGDIVSAWKVIQEMIMEEREYPCLPYDSE